MEINLMRREVKTKHGVKTDKRLLNTKRAILSALIELLSQKDVSDITVTELTERAGVNRKTFYLHYDKIDDVITDFGEDLLVYGQKVILSAFNQKTGSVDIKLLFTRINRAIEENVEFFRAFVSSGAYHIFVSSAIRHKYVSGLHVSLASRIKNPAFSPYVVEYLTSGVTAMYIKWLLADLPAVTLDELSEQACDLVLSTLGGEGI